MDIIAVVDPLVSQIAPESFDTMLADSFKAVFDYVRNKGAFSSFFVCGNATPQLEVMLSAAYKAKQTNTEYDLVDFSGDDWSKIVSLIGQDAFTKLDTSKLPNASSVTAKCAVSPEYSQPYRGTTVILAYNSAKVATPPTTMSDASARVKQTIAHINADIESGLSGIRTAKAFANERAELGKFEQSNDVFKNSKSQFYKAMGRFQAVMEFFLCLLSAAVIAVGGWLIMHS